MKIPSQQRASIRPVPKNFLSILKKHGKCTDSLLEKAVRICPEDINLSTDPEVIKIRRMVNAVMAESHLTKAFVRLKPMGNNVLYGYMKPEHDIWLSVSTFFAKRFPNVVIVLGNNSKSWASYYDKETIRYSQSGPLAAALEELKEVLTEDFQVQTDEIWEEYYWSQYCDERRNIRYYNRNMPKKYLKAAGNKVEANTGRTTLDQFTND